jgi:hypothetical protein
MEELDCNTISTNLFRRREKFEKLKCIDIVGHIFDITLPENVTIDDHVVITGNRIINSASIFVCK